VIFAEELITGHLPVLTEKLGYAHLSYEALSTRICNVPVKLQISAVMIFVTLMCSNVPPMFRAMRIALYSMAHKGGDGEAVLLKYSSGKEDEDGSTPAQALHVPGFRRSVIFLAAVLTEMISWSAILCAGALFAFTSETPDLVIRSAVSVMFVLNVDEIVFAACCSEAVASNMEKTTYKITSLKHILVQGQWVSADAYRVLEHYYGLYGHLLVMSALTVAFVMGLRTSALDCQVTNFQQIPPSPD